MGQRSSPTECGQFLTDIANMEQKINIAELLKDAPKEIWKPIPGYEGLYEASNLGRIKRIWNPQYEIEPHIIKPFMVGKYLSVGLSKDNVRVQRRVHRLVSLAFNPNPNNYPCINHKDEDKLNNCATNLEWCTAKYNCNYGHGIEKCSKARLNDPNRSKPVEALDSKGNVILSFHSLKEAARKGYSKQLISEACRGVQRTKCKTYKHLYWRFRNNEALLGKEVEE